MHYQLEIDYTLLRVAVGNRLPHHAHKQEQEHQHTRCEEEGEDKYSDHHTEDVVNPLIESLAVEHHQE